MAEVVGRAGEVADLRAELELQVRWQAGSERMELPGGGEVVRSGVLAAAAL